MNQYEFRRENLRGLCGLFKIYIYGVRRAKSGPRAGASRASCCKALAGKREGARSPKLLGRIHQEHRIEY